MANFCKEMASYSAHTLGCVMRNGVVCTEIGEFLAQLINGGAPLRMALPRMPLDEYIPTSRITFGKKALEFRGALRRMCGLERCSRSASTPPIAGPGCSTACFACRIR